MKKTEQEIKDWADNPDTKPGEKLVIDVQAVASEAVPQVKKEVTKL